MKETTGVHRDETVFHDDWSSAEQLESVDIKAAFEAPTALENQFILKRLGDLRCKLLLDVGAGLGDASAYLASRGARVVSVDLSPGMAHFSKCLAAHHQVAVHPSVSIAEALPFRAGSFDIVYAANLIHHLPDRPGFIREAHRVLRPGGWFFSYDPLAYNPLINFYRRIATSVRTADEQPLRRADLALVKSVFGEAHHDEFWLSSLALFLKYFVVDRVSPNAERYWRRILKEDPASLWWWRPLSRLDRRLTRIPGLRWMAWNTVVSARKAA